MRADDSGSGRSRRAAVIAAVAVVSLTLGGIAVAQAPFTDIEGNTHEANIRQAYELGLTVGTTPTTYSPRANVRRDQMASFLINSLEHAHPQIEIDWILRVTELAFVLPDGTTITDEEEVEAQLEGSQEQPDELPPVGAAVYATGEVSSAEEDLPDPFLGQQHYSCEVGVEPGRVTCNGVAEIHGQGSLYVTGSFNILGEEEAPEGFPVDFAVTGGTGAFYGATGTVKSVQIDEGVERVSGTVLLHGTR